MFNAKLKLQFKRAPTSVAPKTADNSTGKAPFGNSVKVSGALRTSGSFCINQR